MKILSFYLPQFHPTAENDEWWGKGFTEWTNVTRSRPRFAGHYQPHLPADLGFYDLRVPETRTHQAELAKAAGVDGFCYYHYWFNGKRLLNKPIDAILAGGAPDFPFCLCWANENWTKNWSGENRKVLQPQQHSHEDDVAHIQWLLKAFEDPRYIRIEGKPLMLIYRSDLLPDPADTVATWRKAAAEAGLPGLHLVGVFNNFANVDEAVIVDTYGFDAALEFQPHKRYLPKTEFWSRVDTRLRRYANAVYEKVAPQADGVRFPLTSRHDYRALARNAIAGLRDKPAAPMTYPSVIPSWDNSSRRRDGARVVQNTDPAPYQAWLEAAIRSAQQYGDRGLVFINAWNEWAEGCHLEPDQRVGSAFLDATRDAVKATRR